MGWAASTIYLPDTDDARAVLLAEPRFAGHVHALDLARLEQAPALCDGARGRLLALRSPGRPRAELPDAFDWAGLDGGLGARLAVHRPQLEAANARIAPPDALLRWLEDLAARAGGPLCWYQAEADHGDPDAELCWILDHGGPTILRFPGREVELDRSPAVVARQRWRFLRFGVGEPRPVRDPLAMALLHHGAWLENPWFEPHTPWFDWASRRI